MVFYEALRKCAGFQFAGNDWNSLMFSGSQTVPNFPAYRGNIDDFILNNMSLHTGKINCLYYSIDEVVESFYSYSYSLDTHDDGRCLVSFDLGLQEFAYNMLLTYLQLNIVQEHPDFKIKKGNKHSGIYIIVGINDKFINKSISTLMDYSSVLNTAKLIQDHVNEFGYTDVMKKEIGIVIEKLEEYYEFVKKPKT